MPLRPRTWRRPLGKPRSVLKSVPLALNNMPATSIRKKEWHQHMPTPWDVMQLNPAEALTISCQSCGVQIAPSELRNTYGRSFVIKELAKFNQDCSALFPTRQQDSVPPKDGLDLRGAWLCHPTYPTT